MFHDLHGNVNSSCYILCINGVTILCVYLLSQLDNFDSRGWADVLTWQVSIEWFRECIINDNVLALRGRRGHWLGHHCKKNDIHRQIHIWY